MAITSLRRQIEAHPKAELLKKFFSKYETSYTRNLAPKQLAYIYVERHGGTTNVPKYGAWCEITDLNSQYSDDPRVRFIFSRNMRNSRSYNSYSGGYYTASRSVIKRPDVTACLDYEWDTDMVLPQQPKPKNYDVFASMVGLLTHDTLDNWKFVEQWFNACRGNPAQRLADKFYRYVAEALPKNHRTGDMCRNSIFNRDTYIYNRGFRGGIKGDLKKMGKRYAVYHREAQVLMVESAQIRDVAAFANRMMNILRDNVSNRYRYTSGIERKLLENLIAGVKDKHNLVNAPACGHLTLASELRNIHNYGTGYCPACYDSIVEREGPLVDVLNRDGATVQVLRAYVHTWSDGSKRAYSEPPVIGNYHSSKSLFKKSLPHTTGQAPHESVLKVGYELEFCRKNPQYSDDWYARKMKADIAATLGNLINDTSQPYCGFERDGSVDFEMVAGYGPLDIHRAALIGMLKGNPYANDLQSHNGGKCGFHVHVDKPHSLMHAVRLQAFYNNPFNENLIRAIARRYKLDGYAKVKASKGNMVEAARNLKHQRRYTSQRNHAVQSAITNLTSERYEVVNYLNPNTAEIRIFRGSMIVSTLIACLEFAFMSWYFTRDTAANQLTTENFLKYVSAPEWRHETGYLRRYLWGKGFKVWMPRKKNLRTHTVEA